jgi:hypothetical protein
MKLLLLSTEILQSIQKFIESAIKALPKGHFPRRHILRGTTAEKSRRLFTAFQVPTVRAAEIVE